MWVGFVLMNLKYRYSEIFCRRQFNLNYLHLKMNLKSEERVHVDTRFDQRKK